jgi:hypothetical protein
MVVAMRGGMRCILVLASVMCACDVSTASGPSDQDYEAIVLNQASVEFGCPSANITVTFIDHYTYLAEGCGYRATYECVLQPSTYGPNECQRAPTLEPLDAGCK